MNKYDKYSIYVFLGCLVLTFGLSYLFAHGEPAQKMATAISITSLPFKLLIGFLALYFGMIFCTLVIIHVIGVGCLFFEGFIILIAAVADLFLVAYRKMRKIGLAIKVKL